MGIGTASSSEAGSRSGRSGTPIEWLMRDNVALVEVHCHCAAALAAARFVARKRHPGHADSLRDHEELRRELDARASWGPLFPEGALVVETGRPPVDT
jgi:hypothetical protein